GRGPRFGSASAYRRSDRSSWSCAPLPARLDNPRNLASQGAVPEADAAHLELAQEGPAPAAEAAAVVQPHLELLLAAPRPYDLRCLGHGLLCLWWRPTS